MTALFVSDLHIDESRPHVLAGLRRLLATVGGDVDAVYILGDLVEVWVGDDDDGPSATAVRHTLAEAGRRTAVHVMHGNRDFLLGDAFAAETGVTLLPDPTVIDVDGASVLIAHGDAYCTGDAAYQDVRKQLRSATWQAGVMAMPLAARRELAASMRAQSMAANANKAANIMDVTGSAVEAAMHESETTLMVHGHTHRPGIHELEGGRRRIVLGDWHRCGWYLTLRFGDAALCCFPLTEQTE